MAHNLSDELPSIHNLNPCVIMCYHALCWVTSLPDLIEESDRAWRVASIMIVVKTVDGETARQKLPYDSHPGGGVLLSVDDEAIPCVGDHFDGFPVAEPADVGKIGGYHVMLAHELLNGWHPWMIGQCQSYPMGAQ